MSAILEWDGPQIGIGRDGGSGEWEHTVVVPALHKALIAGRQQQHGPSRGSVDVTEFTRK